jgi:hypothetical protein
MNDPAGKAGLGSRQEEKNSEIHMFGIHLARKIEGMSQDAATPNVRRML